ncbi:YeeE/YedE family protein [Shimia biformata]|uniref:YeeE/YedE family protein n=1 Tax=Shimia biformata TaxID=1294299 RepID=UPI001951FE20|nr:YeeE/YedE family protein [Shimia biformata]
METVLDTIGSAATLAFAGVLVGVVFGASAQRSQFCLRASTVEVAEGRLGPRLAVWLVAFTSALLAVQTLVLIGWLDLSESRAIASVGSLSGAIIGGLMFGAGMILARGCVSRLLVLASGGNLRALITGLVATLAAQASLGGLLSGPREIVAGLWTIPGGSARDLAALVGLSTSVVVGMAAIGFGLALAFSMRKGVPGGRIVASILVGLAVAMGWALTFAISQASFDVVPVSSVTFTGPATDTLMALVTEPRITLSFGLGLVPGVAVGAAIASALAGEWKIQRFGPEKPMESYLVGAVLMGFGAMLAGGCAVGAGMSGGAALSLTAWLAVMSMWVGAMATHRILQSTPALQRL